MTNNQRQSADSEPSRDFSAVEGTIADQRLPFDRRDITKRSDKTDPSDTGLERRRGPGRRRSDLTRAAEEGEMTDEQFIFLMAIDAFKRVNKVTYPTWSDILEILRRLGYRKVQPSQISLPNAEDWTERVDAPISTDTMGGHTSAATTIQDDDADDEDAFNEAA